MNKFLPVSAVFLLICFVNTAFAQSNDQTNPTPVASSQISGEIKARDIGDSRVTTYYYIFGGERGDVFVNVVTSNINGTIDIFTANGLKPRTKITLFADNPESETGRIVYMRESEQLILRIQGRSPNDEPGRFQIKFAGSFVASDAENEDEGPKVSGAATGSVRVNSVGTIIETPVPVSVPTQQTAEEPASTRDSRIVEVPMPAAVKKPDSQTNAQTQTGAENPPKADSIPDKATNVPEQEDKDDSRSTVASKDIDPSETETKELTVEISKNKPRRSALVTISRAEPEVEEAAPKAEPETSIPAAPTIEERLALVQLKIVVKGGGMFMRPMNEVLSMNVIKGILTVVTTDGKIREFSILEVESVKIE